MKKSLENHRKFCYLTIQQKKIKMRILFFLSLLMLSSLLTNGFMNILLIGPHQDIYPFARHYSEFFNIHLLEQKSYLQPDRFIMISEDGPGDMTIADDFLILNFKDYPHKDKPDPNYFISWIKQLI